MQESAKKRQDGARSQRKRLGRTSSLEELRNLMKLRRRESTSDLNEVSPVQNALATSPNNGRLKEGLDNGIKRNPSWPHGWHGLHDELLKRAVQERLDASYARLDEEIGRSAYLRGSASARSDVKLASDMNADQIAQEFLGVHSTGLQWLADGPGVASTLYSTSHKQGFPSPHAIEMVPTSSTVCPSNEARLKKTCVKEEMSPKKAQIGSPRETTQKIVKKETMTPPAQPTENEIPLLPYHPVTGCCLRHMPFNMLHRWALLDRESAGCRAGLFGRSTTNGVQPLHRSSSYVPVRAQGMNAMTFGRERPMRSLSVGTKREDFSNLSRLQAKRLSALKGATNNDTDVSRQTYCLRCKRGRRAKDDTLSSPDSEFGSLAKMQAISSTETSNCRLNNLKRDHPPRPVRESSGRTTFADMVHARFIRPGTQKWAVGHDSDVTVTVKPEGSILYKEVEYNSISSFALAVIRERNPGRRSCDGWKDVKCGGQRLEALRERYLNG